MVDALSSDVKVLPITELLGRIGRGDAAAVERLMTDLYPRLKRIAARMFRSERKGHTLQPTALVNEAYLRVFGSRAIDWRDRAHFFAVVARQIRRILVDHGRARRADKRGGGATKLPLMETDTVESPAYEDYILLDLALSDLAGEDPRAARVVELKFFGGLTDSEIAEVIGISMPTVNRDWRYARTWLFSRMKGEDVHENANRVLRTRVRSPSAAAGRG